MHALAVYSPCVDSVGSDLQPRSADGFPRAPAVQCWFDSGSGLSEMHAVRSNCVAWLRLTASRLLLALRVLLYCAQKCFSRSLPTYFSGPADGHHHNELLRHLRGHRVLPHDGRRRDLLPLGGSRHRRSTNFFTAIVFVVYFFLCAG